MKALVHTAPFVLEYVDVPDPAPAPDELLVRVQACGICGSDVHGYTGTTGRRIPPIIMGHEAAGIVAAVGSKAQGFAVGDRVCFDSTVFCNDCDACRDGLVNRCRHRQVLGVSTPDVRREGAFAEFVLVPWWTALSLAEHVPFDQATLFEPLGIALHAMNRGEVAEHDVVLVIGCGTIGLLTIAAARQRGVRRIVATDVRSERLQRARAMGADEVVDTSAATDDEVRSLLNGGADVTFEAVGFASTIRQAISLTRQGGRAVLVGNLERDVSIDVPDVISREITLIGSYSSAGEFRDAVRLVTDGLIDVRPMLSQTLPLAEGQRAFDRLHAGKEDLVKIVLVP